MTSLPQYIQYMYTTQPNGFQVTRTFIICLRGPRKLTSGKRSRTEPENGREGEQLITKIDNRKEKNVKIEKSGYYLTGR
jgi:hypothetical protein